MQSSVKLHRILFLVVVFVFYRFFNKYLAICCSPVTLYPIMRSSRSFCCLIYSYKNRIPEVKQNNAWLIDMVMVSVRSGYLFRLVLRIDCVTGIIVAPPGPST